MKKSRARSASEEEAKPKKKKKSGKKGKGGGPKGTPKKPTSVERPSLWMPLVLVCFGATINFLGFPGFDLWPLSFFAFIPFFFALDWKHPKSGLGHTTRRAVLLGALFGMISMLGGYYWLVGMLEDFSGFPFILCVLFAAILSGFQGGQLAVFAWLYHRARARGVSPMWIAPIAYAGTEWAWPMLFPYYWAAHYHHLPAMIQSADLGGPILITALGIGVNVSLYVLLRAKLEKRPLPWRGPAIVAGLMAANLVYGFVRVGQVDAAAEAAPKITVGIVQANMDIFDKRLDPGEGLRRHIEQSRVLEDEVQPDLIVWPESAYTYFLPAGTTNVRRYVMGPLETPLLFGGLAYRDVDGVQKHYNTAILADGDGEILSTYDKTYLLAFGEYLPFGETFPILYEWSPHSGRFTPGDHVRPLVFEGYRISALVCYEDIIPRFVRQAVDEADPHLFVNITNDAWFGDTAEPWEHLALAQFRSIEHHRYMVRATNSGVSAIIDPAGRVVVHGGVFTRETLHGEVAMMTGWTLYQSVGDWPGYLGMFFAVLLAFFPDRLRAARKLLSRRQKDADR